ncbi:MAG: hypothetical protein IPP74_10475 [Alphaproteobacteria bacterium]|nr:hypothetical protein [Alphaproteobacteria bacterium]
MPLTITFREEGANAPIEQFREENSISILVNPCNSKCWGGSGLANQIQKDSIKKIFKAAINEAKDNSSHRYKHLLWGNIIPVTQNIITPASGKIAEHFDLVCSAVTPNYNVKGLSEYKGTKTKFDDQQALNATGSNVVSNCLAANPNKTTFNFSFPLMSAGRFAGKYTPSKAIDADNNSYAMTIISVENLVEEFSHSPYNINIFVSCYGHDVFMELSRRAAQSDLIRCCLNKTGNQPARSEENLERRNSFAEAENQRRQFQSNVQEIKVA